MGEPTTEDQMGEYCCVDCFAHPTLRDIVEEESDLQGDCDFCDSQSLPLLHVSVLYDSFHNVVSMYHTADRGSTVAPWEEPSEVGEPLYTILDEHWGVFGDHIAGTDASAQLLRAILESGWDDDSGEPLPDPYELVVSRPSWLHQSPAENWRDFCYAILHDESVDHYISEGVAEDIHILGRELSPQSLFRARLGYTMDESGLKTAYTDHEIGAPPPDRVKPGRANKSCEVVLYVAEQPDTAVAEVRPARGLLVSVGEFFVKEPLRILDLIHKPPEIDPFTNQEFQYWIDFWGLMEEFAQSLSTPLERDDEPHIDYRPSQWLARWFKVQGFQGIRFPSALHAAGVNIVLFDPDRATFRQSWLSRVDDVKWSFSKYDASAEFD